MELNIIAFITLIAYSSLVSQSFMYLIALRNVQKNAGAEMYIELRHLLDKNFRARFRYPFYSTLISTTLLLIFSACSHGGLLMIGSIVAWLGIVCDTVLMMKGNMPINQLINSWTKDQYPADWQVYRDHWLHIFSLRQIANLTGFLFLIAGIVFGR